MADQTKAQHVNAWMEEQAPWYSEHRAFPVCDLAEQATQQFDLHGQYSEDYAEFMLEKRYKQAERTFKRQGLDMGEDAE